MLYFWRLKLGCVSPNLGASQLVSELRDMTYNGDLGVEVGGERRIGVVPKLNFMSQFEYGD
jgi:hypothetical protein